jgi:hypothetical protein
MNLSLLKTLMLSSSCPPPAPPEYPREAAEAEGEGEEDQWSSLID